MSDKPKFDPSQPFEAVKPKFDPTQPFHAEEPGVAAIGSNDGTVPDSSMTHQVLHRGGQALTAGGKALDVLRGGITGPMLAEGLQALTGKQVASWKDWENAINPTNLKTFPTANEMYDRAGVPEGAKLSDYVGGYGEPGKSPWYHPEKGGLLDPTVRGIGGFATDTAIDPLTYLSGGVSAAAKKATAESVTKQVAKEGAGTLGKAAQKFDKVIEMGTEPLRKFSDKVQQIPYAGPIINRMATAPSDAVDWLGKKLYNSAILPIEHEGEKFGKEAVGQTLYDLGISNPVNLGEKTQKGADALMTARNKILTEAGDKGAKVDVNSAMNLARETMNEIRAKGNPRQQWIADELEKQIKEHEKMIAGEAAKPASTKIVDTGLVDEGGNAVTKEIAVPGTEAKPGREVTPMQGSELKTDQYKATPDATWNELRKTPEGAKVTKPLAQGLNDETLKAVGNTLGEESARKVDGINSEVGKILSTQNATRNVEKQADRLAHGAVAPTGTAKVMGILHGPTGVAMDMAGNAARLATMPTGYFMRQIAEGRLTKPMIDAYLRRHAVEGFNQGGENGQN